ncbi:MAG: hypothetical protein RR945_00375 [Erysipelotrichaceae bacterium]
MKNKNELEEDKLDQFRIAYPDLPLQISFISLVASIIVLIILLMNT